MTQKSKADNLNLPANEEADFMKRFFEYRNASQKLKIPANRISLRDQIRLRMQLSSLSADYGFEPYVRVLKL